MSIHLRIYSENKIYILRTRKTGWFRVFVKVCSCEHIKNRSGFASAPVRSVWQIGIRLSVSERSFKPKPILHNSDWYAMIICTICPWSIISINFHRRGIFVGGREQLVHIISGVIEPFICGVWSKPKSSCMKLNHPVLWVARCFPNTVAVCCFFRTL